MEVCGMKRKIKWVNIIAFVILFVNVLLMLYINFTVKKENTALFNKETYSFNDGWVLTNLNGTISKKVTLPYISRGELPQKSEDSIESSERKDNIGFSKPQNDIPHFKPEDNIQLPKTEDDIPSIKTEDDQQVNTNREDIIILENYIPKQYWGLTLSFYLTDTEFRVLIDGETVYEKNNEENELFEKRGNIRRFINIPPNLKEGKIQVELFSGPWIRIENIEIAKRDTVILNWIGSNMFNILCCIIMLVSCIIMFLLAAIRKHSKQSIEGMLYLGFFCFDASVYYALNTQILNVFIENQTILNLSMYICLMLLPYFLVVYYGETLADISKKRYIILWRFVTANIFLQIFLHALKLLDLSKMEAFTHILLLVTIFITLISLFRIFRRKHGRKIRYELAAAAFLIIGEIADIIRMYILHTGNVGQLSRYGMTIFCVIMILLHIVKVSKGYSESVEQNQRLLKNKVEYMKQQNEKLTEAKEEAEAARKEAITANETKGRFLANMSHEIRTPINAVLGMDEMILRESGEPTIKEYAMDIQTAGQSLLSLINDILDFSKIDSGKMEIIPVEYEFSSMVHDVVNMILLKAQAKKLELKVFLNPELPSGLYGDDVRIRQVLINILTNAVKYTHNGSISFRINGHSKGDTVILHFEVEDTGIGIKKEDLSKLFQKFERIDEKKNRNIEGTGLGINITANLLLLMNSKLEVESEYGVGSKFFFDIEQKIVNKEPIGDLEERIRIMSEEYSYDADFKAPEARILVVDDNLVNCKVFKNLLKETEMQVDDVNSGKACIEKVSSNAYNLIFLDHMMPEMDGIETLHHLQKMKDYPSKNAKIIALTANAISGAKEMYLKEGFDAFLSKPILSNKLEELIRKLLPKELLIFGKRQKPWDSTTDSKSENQMEIPDIDGLDWDFGRLHLSEELLLDTIKDFYLTLESQADVLLQSYNKGDMERYRIQVHSMKSTSALIGIIPLAGMAKVLEYAAQDGKKDIINHLNDIFLKEWLSYKQKLSILFDEKDKQQKTEDTSIALAYLEMLRTAMENMDIDAADNIMENLNQLFYNEEINKHILQLAANVTNLDTESAIKQIETLIEMLNSL